MTVFLEQLKNHPLKESNQACLLWYTIHDWITHISGNDSYLLPQYDSSLLMVIKQKLCDSDPVYTDWIQVIVRNPISIKSLLYRHHLFSRLVHEEITTDVNSSSLYLLFGSLYYPNVRFSVLEDESYWPALDTSQPVINQLRAKKPRIIESVLDIADRTDETEYRLDRDHARLSSHSLLYGLYLVYVSLTYENTVRSDPNVQAILDSLTNTLSNLKGIFHDSSLWLFTHVR